MRNTEHSNNVSSQSSKSFTTFGFLQYIKHAMSRHKVGELLVHRGNITPLELRHALKVQQKSKGKKALGQIFIDLGYISRFQLLNLLVGQRVFRVAATCAVYIVGSGFGVKSSHAQSIKDVPARIVLASATPGQISALSSYPALFGATEKKSTNLKAFTKWTGMFERFDKALDETASKKIIKALQIELNDYRSSSVYDMANDVNDMMNRKRYVLDQNNWGQSDYWATPIEFMARGGDCEDFAIAKYAALRALGVPENRLRVAIVQDEEKNIPHAILIVYTERGPMVLDNQIKKMRSANRIAHYKPIFSINRTAWWLHTKPVKTNTIVASAR